jgi:hypothetical protein
MGRRVSVTWGAAGDRGRGEEARRQGGKEVRNGIPRAIELKSKRVEEGKGFTAEVAEGLQS